MKLLATESAEVEQQARNPYNPGASTRLKCQEGPCTTLRQYPRFGREQCDEQCFPCFPWQLLYRVDPVIVHILLLSTGHIEVDKTQMFIIGRFALGFSP